MREKQLVILTYGLLFSSCRHFNVIITQYEHTAGGDHKIAITKTIKTFRISFFPNSYTNNCIFVNFE